MSIENKLKQASVLIERNLFIEARKILRSILLKSPVQVDALYMLSIVEASTGKTNEALHLLAKLLRLDSNHYGAIYSMARILSDLGLHADSMPYHELAVSLKPDNFWAYLNRGNSYSALENFNCALQDFCKAIDLNPLLHSGFCNRGNVLRELKHHEEALRDFAKAIALNPQHAESWCNQGNAFKDLKRNKEALESYDRAVALRSDYVEAWLNRGAVLSDMKNHEESAKSYLIADQLRPNQNFSLGSAHHQMMLVCDWLNFDFYKKRIDENIRSGNLVAEPFGYQGIADSEFYLHSCAKIYSREKFPTKRNNCLGSRESKQKIRIGYLCGEFRNQATTHLMIGVWESHDRSRFEIYGFDNGWDDGSVYRQRIKAAFPNFFDISGLTAKAAAQLINDNQIDILVNLNGFFGSGRQDIFALKPAPIAVNYLGFPGTMGADYIDYLVADEIVIPRESRQYYTEKIVYLPFCYQANDNKKPINSSPISRDQFGLPLNAFVFCCFNNAYKITPTIFDVWMDILKQAPESVLWLIEDSTKSKENLLDHARVRGVGAERLIFAARIEPSMHLARHRLADLFLDTAPYNAHTTASDALWAGLPLVTLVGSTFPGRVGASLLSAVGLPQLVTTSIDEYKNLALSLATHPEKLNAIRATLHDYRLTKPLFDTQLTARHLEKAYREMFDRYLNGDPVEHISIEP